jgi:hypothetical protein
MANTQGHDTLPWGRTTGLLAACLATLIGVWRGLDPEVILARAVSAGIVVGVLGVLVTGIWQWWLQQEAVRMAAGRTGDRPGRPEITAAKDHQDAASRQKAE